MRTSFWGGLAVGFAFTGWSQDRFGSLDAYIGYLRASGDWVQVPVWVWAALFVFGVAGSAFDGGGQ